MIKKFIIFLGVLMALTACNAHLNKTDADMVESAQAANTDDQILVRLENGLNVLIKKDDRFPLVNVRLYVHAGSAYETRDIAGISHQLEHMVFKGTSKRAPGQTALEVESAGGSLNAATSFDYTVYYVEMPDTKWKLGMDIVTDMAFNASIDPDELESEKQVVLSELERGEDNPSSRLFKSIQAMMWKGSTYEWPIIGYRDTVSALTSKKIHAYIDKFYQPQSMLLTVVGNVDPKKILAEAKQLLGDKKNTREITPPTVIPVLGNNTGPQFSLIKGKWNKVYLGAAFPIPNLKSAKIAGLEVLGQLMGGDDTSRLYRKFKYEGRLVDDIGMSPMSLERGGFMYVHAVLDADKVEEFWTKLMQELSSFDPSVFTDREIERAKLNIEDSMFLSKETLSGLASKLGYFQLFEEGEQSEQNYLFALNHVDRAEMGGLFKEFINPNRMATCILVPEGSEVSQKSLEGITNTTWNGSITNAEKHDKADSAMETVELQNGSTLVLQPDSTLPYTAMSLFWTGGDGNVPLEKQGLASLTAKTLTRGTKDMTSTELEDFLSDHAASVGASSGRNVFSFEAKFPSRFSADVLPKMQEVLLEPTFDKAEVDRSKQDQIAAIKRKEDRPLGMMFRHLFPFLFGNSPYNMLSDGTADTVDDLSRTDIREFWKNQSSNPFILCVVGDYDREQVVEFAKTVANKLPKNEKDYVFAPTKWNPEHNKSITLPDRNQAHLLMIFPMFGKSELKHSAELDVLKAVLSGQSGLLFRDMRDKQGLAYTVTAIGWQTIHDGLMALYIGTKPETVNQSLEGFKKVVHQLQTDLLPEEELTRAKNILTGEYYQEHQSLLSRSREAASLMIQGFEKDHTRKLIEEAQSVTAEDIRNLARKYLDPENAYLMKVTP